FESAGGHSLIDKHWKISLLKAKLIVVGVCLLAFSKIARTQDGNAEWSAVIAGTVPSVVSLQISYVRDFVETSQGVSSATGFIVDAERGIILTNRHVVGSGPISMTATFQNLERIDVVPLYRDPVHDFGFLRYDPADLKRNQPRSLNLNAAGAKVGTDIRVIGSDGGEQLSILTGTIARVDRAAPNYGRYGHNDFNTFYLQAASSTSGGSSGSPVLNSVGEVIALNAAANSSTASSFFLPLDRIVYALEKLQAGEPVDRGTLQTVFEQRPYRLLSRFGLGNDVMASYQQQFPSSNGMLLVRQVLPGGAAEGVLLEGDVLLAVDGQPVAEFIRLAEILDSSIGRDVELDVFRQGKQITMPVTVRDMDALQPSRLVEVGGAVLHDISVQRARGMNRPQVGVMMAKSGYEFARAGVQRGAVITELNGQRVNTLDDITEHLQSGESEWRLRFVVPGREFTSSVATVDINDRWFGSQVCERRDDARFWQCDQLPMADVATAPAPLDDVVLPGYTDNRIQSVAPSLVRLSFDIPYAVDNVYAKSFTGVGLVVDAERGLVVTDRNTVPVELGDLEITFFSTYKLPGKVVFLHPLHNIAILQYDPALLGDVSIDTLELADSFPVLDDSLELIGYRNDGTIRKQKVDNLSEVTLYFDLPQLSRFQQVPADVLSASLVGPTLGGPLIDQHGVIQAVWQSFAYQSGDEIKEGEWAMPASLIRTVVERYTRGDDFYIMPGSFVYQSLDKARERGLSSEWIRKVAASAKTHRRVMAVRQVVGSDDNPLMVGDFLLQVNGSIPSTFSDLEALFQQPLVDVKVLRDGRELDLQVPTQPYNNLVTRRALLWAGSLIQEPHFELEFQRGNKTQGVFISGTLGGSPSIQDRLYRNRFITEVEGVPVSSLNEFIHEIQARDASLPVSLTVVAMNGYRSVVSVQPEYNFWPTVELVNDGNGWVRKVLDADQVAVSE
ncbi:MAG: trypsin-like peptidase domain-containing protein, partial [Pseudomonadota bacterium]